jgi:EAL domain-containing protein (putative c-di-GMP-specific phosphodiesterase class I)
MREVHFDEIKIDRSFVQTIEHDLRSKILLSAMTKLGLELGSRLVTEGVETEAQLHMVQGAGCEIIQGFFYSKPTPLDTLVGDV